MLSRRLLTFLLTLCLLTACGVVDTTGGYTPISPKPSAIPETATPTPLPQPIAPDVLRVWVTPRFDPASDSLLQARLDAFAADHAGLTIEVRVKDETQIVEALRLTAFAAPSISPDLIEFSRANLESAAAQGLIQPLDTSLLDNDTWHPLARSLSSVQDEVYGLPFALDALALATSSPESLGSWQDLPEKSMVAFNTKDASFPLALYLSAGGELADSNGNLTLNETVLAHVLAIFTQDQILPLDTDAEVASTLGPDGNFAVGWASGLMNSEQAGVRLEALPGLENPSATLVTSWGWSVVNADVERQRLALELAQWLTADDFLSEWTPSLGLLSPRVDVRWKPLLDSARPVPSAELMNAAVPILNEAVASVLEGTSPEDAAQAAVAQVK